AHDSERAPQQRQDERVGHRRPVRAGTAASGQRERDHRQREQRRDEPHGRGPAARTPEERGERDQHQEPPVDPPHDTPPPGRGAPQRSAGSGIAPRGMGWIRRRTPPPGGASIGTSSVPTACRNASRTIPTSTPGPPTIVLSGVISAIAKPAASTIAAAWRAT